MATRSRPHNWNGVVMTDAQAEALSRLAWSEAGKHVKGGLQMSTPTARRLRELGLITGDPAHLRLTEAGRAAVSMLPDWDWGGAK